MNTMAVEISDEDFDEAVGDALDGIPEALMHALDNVVVLVEDDPPDSEPDLLGLYEGVPLTDRDSDYGGVLPDAIFLFRNPLKRMCETREELIEEIRVTVIHEIAHFFGIEDDHLDELGWG